MIVINPTKAQRQQLADYAKPPAARERSPEACQSFWCDGTPFKRISGFVADPLDRAVGVFNRAVGPIVVGMFYAPPILTNCALDPDNCFPEEKRIPAGGKSCAIICC